jgi:hypothetical protein
MKRAVLAALAIVTLSTGAHAEPTSFAALPQGAIPSPPAVKPPARIPASEKVAGFYVTVPEFPARKMRGKAIPRFAQLFANEEQSRGGAQRDACFAEDAAERASKGRAAPEEEQTSPRAWSSLQQMLSFSSRDAGTAIGVRAVHAERVVVSGDTASLESTDAWVDPDTHGVRLIGRSSAPLRLLGAVPNGPRVWAMREGADKLDLIVTEDPQMLVRGESLMAMPARGSTEGSSCAHLRVSLAVEKGGADAVSVLSAAELPPLDRGDGRAAKGNDEVRIRPLRVHASVTWTSHDNAPVLSLSFGWETRAHTVPGAEAP